MKCFCDDYVMPYVWKTLYWLLVIIGWPLGLIFYVLYVVIAIPFQHLFVVVDKKAHPETYAPVSTLKYYCDLLNQPDNPHHEEIRKKLAKLLGSGEINDRIVRNYSELLLEANRLVKVNT